VQKIVFTISDTEKTML